MFTLQYIALELYFCVQYARICISMLYLVYMPDVDSQTCYVRRTSSFLTVPASLLAREPSENAMAMTTEEVIQWLQSIKLSKYTEIFKNNEVDGYILACCTLQTLEEMGIDKDLDRRKIFALFRKIK